jgi:hypothetical protein
MGVGLDQYELLRTPFGRSSQNLPSTRFVNVNKGWKRKGRGVMLRPFAPVTEHPTDVGRTALPYIPFIMRSWPLMAPSGYGLLWTLT